MNIQIKSTNCTKSKAQLNTKLKKCSEIRQETMTNQAKWRIEDAIWKENFALKMENDIIAAHKIHKKSDGKTIAINHKIVWIITELRETYIFHLSTDR